ncbi:MAG: hypothetical protein IIB75_06810 [Proteobacteria bacterium]|nr:hypothetical protein [Pseudomonadota bacterium]
MNSNPTFREQIRRNTVALISLAIAITSLGYNTWRNEASEHNRNQRLVSIQMLIMLGELQQVVLDRRYGRDSEGKAVLRKGWALVLTLRDIAMVADGDVPESAELLFEVWQRDSSSLGSSDAAKQRIDQAVDAVRHDTHDILRSLD